MTEHVAKIFEDRTLQIDGQTFVDCEFNRARLMYAGGSEPVFNGCTLRDVTWEFTGAALRTMQVLHFMNEVGPAGLRADIDRMIGRKA